MHMHGHMYVCMYVSMYARNPCICRVMSFWAIGLYYIAKTSAYAGVPPAYAGSYVLYVCMYAMNPCICRVMSCSVNKHVMHATSQFSVITNK